MSGGQGTGSTPGPERPGAAETVRPSEAPKPPNPGAPDGEPGVLYVVATPIGNLGDVTLQAGETQVGPMGRIDLTGTYQTGEGAVLQVQRATGPGDSWVDFPVTATVSGGTFSTYVQTGRTGPNRFRVIDTDTDLVSNEVTITIG